jgi:hypothetical protein
MGGAVHPLLLYAFMTCIGTTLYLTYCTLLGINPENIVYIEFETYTTLIIIIIIIKLQ